LIIYKREKYIMTHRLGFTSRRRAFLAKKVDRLDRLETRNTMTEPISAVGLLTGSLRGLVQLGLMQPNGASNTPNLLALAEREAARSQPPLKPVIPISSAPILAPISAHTAKHSWPGGGGAAGSPAADQGAKPVPSDVVDALALFSSNDSNGSQLHGFSTPWQPATPSGGGAAMAPRGGSGAASPAKPAPRAALPPVSLPPSMPAAINNGGARPHAPAAPELGAGSGGAHKIARGAPSQPAEGTTLTTSTSPCIALGGSALSADDVSGGSSSGGSPALGSVAGPSISTASGPSQESFPYFPLYVLDVNDGVVLFPGVDQSAA
jgi:hypothetical protein